MNPSSPSLLSSMVGMHISSQRVWCRIVGGGEREEGVACLGPFRLCIVLLLSLSLSMYSLSLSLSLYSFFVGFWRLPSLLLFETCPYFLKCLVGDFMILGARHGCSFPAYDAGGPLLSVVLSLAQRKWKDMVWSTH